MMLPPEAYVIDRFRVDSRNILKLFIAKGGGAAVSIREATGTDDLKKIKAYR